MNKPVFIANHKRSSSRFFRLAILLGSLLAVNAPSSLLEIKRIPSSLAAPDPTVGSHLNRLRNASTALLGQSRSAKAKGWRVATAPLSRPQGQVGPNSMTPWTRAQATRLAALRWRSGKQLKAAPRDENGTVRYLSGWRLEEAAASAAPGLTLAETTAFNLLEHNSALLRIEDAASEWELDSSVTDKLGYTHVRFQQSYQGLEVWPASATVQIDPNGHANQLHAAYAPTPADLNVEPTLAMGEALDRAVLHLQGLDLPFTETPEIEDQSLLVYAPLQSDPHLSYAFHLHETSGVAWNIYIEAHTGDVLTAFNHVCTAAVQGSGDDAQGNTQTIELWQDGSEFALVNTTKSMFSAERSNPPSINSTFGGILIFDAENISPQDNPDAFNPKLVASINPNNGFGPNAVSAAVNLALVYDYYEARHQRLSIDGQGGSIIGVINVPINNAYWQNDIITFGNEDKWAHALDFAGHEMTHGIIEKSAGLIYQDQPGALNEAFADILGESVEAFHHNGVPDWKLGTRLAMPLRDMKQPGSLEIGLGRVYPSRMSEFIAPTDAFLNNFDGRDNGGVHLNSSVINHAFYQLAEGLPNALGLLSAERIFYRALTTKLQKQSQFIDCRIACIQSAEELFGTGSDEAMQTAAAFNAVEIFDQAPTPEPTPIPTIEGEDSTLFTFTSAIDGQTYLARREAGFTDDLTGILLVSTPVAPGKRPVVSRNGEVALFVTSEFSLGLVDTETGVVEVFGEANSVWSVGLSPDGTYLGFVLGENNQPENIIRVVNIETEETEEYELKSPALDGGQTDTILFADALNFTPNNVTLYYDALNRITFSDGSQLNTWSIYSIDRLTGTTVSIVPPIPGLDMGNPALGRSFSDHMVFEAGDSSTGLSHVFTQDLSTGTQTEVGVIVASNGLAFPDFFGDDSAVLYSDYGFNEFGFLTTTGLSRQPLGADGLTPDGQASVWLFVSAVGPTIGTIYRRGDFEGVSTVQVSVTSGDVSEAQGGEAVFIVSRSEPVSETLQVSFTLTGTASPMADYGLVGLSAHFAPQQTEISVSIPLVDDAVLEEDETLTLTLGTSPNYNLSDSPSATLTIRDDDKGPVEGVQLWMVTNGISDLNADPDGDGRANLLEYALGSLPTSADSVPILRSALSLVQGQPHVVITLQRSVRPRDVTYSLEQSLDFADWASAGELFQVIDDRESELKWRTLQPITAASEAFFRLRVDLK